MHIIPAIASKSITKENTVATHILIVDAYSKVPRLYGIERITSDEVMEKLDVFQAIFGKLDEFGWWYLERI